MARRWRIRKGDQVTVLVGKDKGKKGTVLRVLRDKERVVVEGVNMRTRHQKPSAQFPEGGKIEIETSLHVSNVAHVDPESERATRVGVRILEDGRKVRYAKRSDKSIDE